MRPPGSRQLDPRQTRRLNRRSSPLRHCINHRFSCARPRRAGRRTPLHSRTTSDFRRHGCQRINRIRKSCGRNLPRHAPDDRARFVLHQNLAASLPYMPRAVGAVAAHPGQNDRQRAASKYFRNRAEHGINCRPAVVFRLVLVQSEHHICAFSFHRHMEVSRRDPRLAGPENLSRYAFANR